MSMKYNFKSMMTGSVVALYAAMPVMADDIEIYTAGAIGAPVVQPNIMFLVKKYKPTTRKILKNLPLVTLRFGKVLI